MATRIALLCLLAFAAIAPARGEAPALQPLASGDYARLVAARAGEPVLVVLWSVTCAPCRDEFALLRELQAEHPRLPLVLVSTDDVADADVAARALEAWGMADAGSLIFAGDAQRLRWEIDPAWYGELPRAYFYDAAHRREGVSGRLGRTQVEDWLRRVGRHGKG